MRARLATMAWIAALTSGTACAMSEASSKGDCRVIGGEKLPADTGGPDALCRAVAAATAELAPGVPYSVQITVLANSRLSASITIGDGRKLADRNFARMDRPLSSDAIQRFARAIATDLAQAGTGAS